LLWVATLALALNFKWEASDWFLDGGGKLVPYFRTPEQWSRLILVAFACALVNLLEMGALLCCAGDSGAQQFQCVRRFVYMHENNLE